MALGVLSVGIWLSAGAARAHFTLVEPASWLEEDFIGGPQKMGPCGPGGGDGTLTETNDVTEFDAGETITVSWQITIPHAGYFRIALAEDRADFTEPEFDDPVACTFNLASVPTGPHDNVLMDGIDAEATSQQVTLPNEPCENCTLQVIQVMQNHGPPNCTYYHCAAIKIVGGNAGAGGGGGATGGSGGISGTGGGGGSPTAGGSGGGMMGMAGMTAPPAGGAGSGAPPPMMMAGGGGGGSGTIGSPVTGTPMAGTGAPVTTPQSGGGGSSSGCSAAAGPAANGAQASVIAIALLPLVRRRRARR